MISDQRPHLEYAVQVWSSKKEIDIDLSYETRLKRLGINRLEDRLVRGDSIEMYKSLKRLDEIKSKWVNTPKFGVITRSNEVKIRRETFKSRI